MKTVAALLALVSLAVIAVEGQPVIQSQRCLCLGAGVNMVKPRLIEKIEIFPKGPSCGQSEVIVTLKNGAGKKCLNPQSKFTQKIIERIANKTRSPQ